MRQSFPSGQFIRLNYKIMNVFITGGSRGIGASLVISLVAAGHDVAFTWLSAKDKADEVIATASKIAPRQKCMAWQMDVRAPQQIEEVGDAVIEALGSVDVVINNAGIVRIGMAVTLPDEDWEDVLAANLSGPFYVCRFFLNEFLINGGGRFIHVSSVARTGMAGQISYCASKAGLDGLSTALAKEYGRKNITSNVISLGFFETDMSQKDMSGSRVKFWDEFCPAGRMGRLSEVADAVFYLMSDGAGFVNGQTLNLTGGMDWVT